jgi:hypothetical protein
MSANTQLHLHATAGYGGIGLNSITKEDVKLVEAAFHTGKQSVVAISNNRSMQVFPRDWKAVCDDQVILTRAVTLTSCVRPADTPCPNADRSEWALFSCSCQADSPCAGAAALGTMADGSFVMEMFSEDLDGQAPGTGHYRVEVSTSPIGLEEVRDRSYLPARHRLSQSILFSMIHSFMIRTLYSDTDKHYILNCETVPCKRDCMVLKAAANPLHSDTCYGCYPVTDDKFQEMLDELKRNCRGQQTQHKCVYQMLLLENDAFYRQVHM